MNRRPLQDVTNTTYGKRARRDKRVASSRYSDDGEKIDEAPGEKDAYMQSDDSSDTDDDDDDEVKESNDDVWQLERTLMEVGESRWFCNDGVRILARTEINSIPLQLRLTSVQEQATTPLQWLHKACQFQYDLSLQRGVPLERVKEFKALCLPEFIIQHCEPILLRMLEAFLAGDSLDLTKEDISKHLGILQTKLKDGVYVRFGLGIANTKGALFGANVTEVLGQDQSIQPRFHYIGESNDMQLRTLTHNMAALTTTDACYRYDHFVQAMVQLPLILLSDKIVPIGYTTADIRYFIEGILIAAFGSFRTSDKYNDAHQAAGLCQAWLPGANNRASIIHRCNFSQVVPTSLNPSLRPFYGNLFNAYLERSCPQVVFAADRSIQAQANDRLQAAKKAYKDEKARLLRAGTFVARLSAPHRSKGSRPYYSLTNFYAAGILEQQKDELLGAGLLTMDDSGSFSVTLLMRDTKPSEDDFYIRSHPGNYDLVCGIQIVAHRDGKEMALQAPKGGPKKALVAGTACRRTELLMQFLVDYSRNSSRQVDLAKRPLPWWKRREDSRRATPDSITAKLSNTEVQLLDGTMQLYERVKWPKGVQEHRKVLEELVDGNKSHQLLSIRCDQFFLQNPQCVDVEPIYFRADFSKTNESANLSFGGRSASGLSSGQIPFAVQVWTRTTGWQALNLQCIGGQRLLNILGEFVSKFRFASLSVRSVPSPSTFTTSAPKWIDSTVKAYTLKGHLADRGYFRLQPRLRCILRQDGSPYYYLNIDTRTAASLTLVDKCIIHLHIEFWDHADANNYRLLVRKEGQIAWHTITMPPAMRTDLEAYRLQHRS